jgi:hypothetical protein
MKADYMDLIAWMVGGAGLVIGAFLAVELLFTRRGVGLPLISSMPPPPRKKLSLQERHGLIEKKIELQMDLLGELPEGSVEYRDCLKRIDELIGELESW